MIVVCEPLCWGWEHVTVNAALLEIVRRAFPSHEVAFYGEASHIANLQSQLTGAISPSIIWRPVPLPHRHAGRGERWYADFKLLRRLLRVLRTSAEGHLLLCAATPTMMLTVKTLVWSGAGRGKGVQILCHGGLANLRGWRSRNPFARMLDWRSGVTVGNSRRIQFIVMEEPIRKTLLALFPALADHLAVLDHPIPSSEVPEKDIEFRPPFRFGFLGLATDAKGFPAFLEIAAVLRRQFPDRVEFHAVAAIPPNTDAPNMEALTVKAGAAMLSRSEYTHSIRKLHYVCLPYQCGHYELSPSGVLMDAIAFGNPVLSSRIPLVEGLFARFGDIGFLCTDTRDFCETIAQIVESADEGRYGAQVRALYAVRESRSAAALAPNYQELTHRLMSS